MLRQSSRVISAPTCDSASHRNRRTRCRPQLSTIFREPMRMAVILIACTPTYSEPLLQANETPIPPSPRLDFTRNGPMPAPTVSANAVFFLHRMVKRLYTEKRDRCKNGAFDARVISRLPPPHGGGL